MRIVFDTSSLITALRSHTGAAAQVLRLILEENVVILMDYRIASEYRDVGLRAARSYGIKVQSPWTY